MNRRDTVLALLALVVAPHARGQQPRRVYRIGYPAISPLSGLKQWVDALEQGLRDHGYSPGKDVLVEVRSADGKFERYPEVVQEILRIKPDVILTGANSNTSAVKAATQEIPIVMVLGTDVVRAGYVKSLANPGGNITGMTIDVGGDIVAKRLELLRDIAPKIARVAILWEAPHRFDHQDALESAASRLGLNMSWQEYSGDPEKDFAEMTRGSADAVFHLAGARMYGRRAAIAALDAKHRLPGAYNISEFADAGGLMSYGANNTHLFRSAARHVDRIFKGARPGELPVEQPTKIDLVINLKAAKALGMTVPQSVLLRADRVID
jgi:putative tryptophan/tyrosine transport system substrate-binding protein